MGLLGARPKMSWAKKGRGLKNKVFPDKRVFPVERVYGVCVAAIGQTALASLPPTKPATIGDHVAAVTLKVYALVQMPPTKPAIRNR